MLYKIGRIYRIICIPNPTIQYVGSTFNELRHRWCKHKGHYKENKEGNSKRAGCSIWKYFDQYGIENFKIILIKEYQVCAEHNKDHKHLRVYEQLWISKVKCINEKNTFSIEWIAKRQRILNRKLQQNKEKKAEYDKKYHERHKERRNKKTKEWVEKNQERVKQKQKEYRKNNKEKIKQKKSEKIQCECGAAIGKYYVKEHLKTKKHKKIYDL